MKELTEKEAESLLEKKGFSVVKRITAKNKKELFNISKKIEFPWVMKASGNIIHKAKVGAVRLNIKNIDDAIKAYDDLSKIPGFKEVMVQQTIKGEEIIIGLKETPEFSHVLMFGKGGGNVEKEKDVSFRVLPVKEKDIKNMIKDTKFYSYLEENEINMKLLVKTIQKVSNLPIKIKGLVELDINPLFINKNHSIIADARLLIK